MEKGGRVAPRCSWETTINTLSYSKSLAHQLQNGIQYFLTCHTTFWGGGVQGVVGPAICDRPVT